MSAPLLKEEVKIPSESCIQLPEWCACVTCAVHQSKAIDSDAKPTAKRHKRSLSLSKGRESQFATPLSAEEMPRFLKARSRCAWKEARLGQSPLLTLFTCMYNIHKETYTPTHVRVGTAGSCSPTCICHVA